MTKYIIKDITLGFEIDSYTTKEKAEEMKVYFERCDKEYFDKGLCDELSEFIIEPKQ